MRDVFTRFARATARLAGTPLAFILAVAFIVVWAVTGPLFRFSNTWQLVVNTATTILTFLMVFLLQNSQNRDSEALQLKLDEVIRAMRGAHNEMLAIENLSDDELKALEERYEKLREARSVSKKAAKGPSGAAEKRQAARKAKSAKRGKSAS